MSFTNDTTTKPELFFHFLFCFMSFIIYIFVYTQQTWCIRKEYYTYYILRGKEVTNDMMYDVLIIFHWNEKKERKNYKLKNNKTINSLFVFTSSTAPSVHFLSSFYYFFGLMHLWWKYMILEFFMSLTI